MQLNKLNIEGPNCIFLTSILHVPALFTVQEREETFPQPSAFLQRPQCRNAGRLSPASPQPSAFLQRPQRARTQSACLFAYKYGSQHAEWGGKKNYTEEGDELGKNAEKKREEREETEKKF